MKSKIAMAVLLVLIASSMVAAAPHQPQQLTGILQWTRGSICGASDFISNPVMANVYLVGHFKPAYGILQGCQVDTSGFYYNAGYCRYFFVEKLQTSCAGDQSIGSTR